MKRLFRLITLKQILPQICPGDWFMLLDLKDAYFNIQVAPHHRQFLRFAFEGVAYQYKVLPFGISLAPHTFTRCMAAVLSPVQQIGICIPNYPRRLAHSGPVVGGFNIAQDPPPQPLRLPGAQGQICQEHTVTQPSNGDSGLCISPGPLEGPLLAKARCDPRHGAQKKGCYNRHFQQWFVSAVRGQTDLRPMVRRGVGPAH